MSMMENDYYYAKLYRQNTPSWYRLERYDYCESFNENALSAKRSIFTRRFGKKRGK